MRTWRNARVGQAWRIAGAVFLVLDSRSSIEGGTLDKHLCLVLDPGGFDPDDVFLTLSEHGPWEREHSFTRIA